VDRWIKNRLATGSMSVLGMLEQESQWLKIAAWNRLATFAEPKGCATNSYFSLVGSRRQPVPPAPANAVDKGDVDPSG